MARPLPNSPIRQICSDHDNRPDALIEIMHTVQAEQGFLSDEALREIADALNLSRADVYGVVTFYHDFRQVPLNGPDIKICRAEACQAVGGEALAKHAKDVYPSGTSDTYCLGNCALAPAIMINDRLYGRVDRERFDRLFEQEQKA